MLSSSLAVVLATSTLATAPIVTKPKVGPILQVEHAAVTAAPKIPVPLGYGHYCSLTYPSGGWAFDWKSASEDPCADMLASSPGGTIARAGLWSTSGANNVVYACDTGVGLLKDYGPKALQAAFNDSAGKKNCVFTVAPKSLPIFSHPFPSKSDVGMTNGFDFARGFTVKDNSGVERNAVNYKGVNASGYDGHDGFDWIMPTGTKLVAMAPGRVLLARSRDVTHHCPQEDELMQKEVYVVHVVGSGKYKEIFVAYYAHLDTMSVSTGDNVTTGTKLGTAGDTGCSEPAHLHLTVSRFSNVAWSYRRGVGVPATEDYDKLSVIDPYSWSWSAKAGFDPWAWRKMSDRGALSISLWKTGLAPKRD
jgi:murein DD-endopeptidase MepM/ murein hydrolase activator NlpD